MAHRAGVTERAWCWLAGGCILAACAPGFAGGLVDPTGRYAVQRWTVEDGLPDAPLTGVAVAPDGTVLVASRSTLARFDGVRFTPLAEPLVAWLHERIGSFWTIGVDPSGRLWVQGGREIARLADETAGGAAGWRVHGVPAGEISSLAFTPDGRPLVVGHDSVFVLDGGALRPLRVEAEEPATWSYGGVDPATGTLWLWGADAERRTLLRGPLPTGGEDVIVVEPADSKIAASLISMAFNADGPVALLRDAAAVFREGRWQRATPVLPDAEHRSSGKIAAADGTLWISNHTGLLAARGGVLDAPTARLPAFSYFTRGLVADANGGAWAACNGGLVAIRRTLVQSERVADCRAVLERSDGSLLVGAPGTVWELPGDAATDGPAEARALVALPDDAVPTAIVEDPGGRIWVGTRDNFLLRVEGDRAVQVTGPDAYNRELRSIQSLVLDVEGRIWAATGNGLAVQQAAGADEFSFIPSLSGRDGPVIIGLAADPAGGVLVASAAGGVIHVTIDSIRRPVLPVADLPGRRDVVLFHDSGGTLWVGGERGIIRVATDGSTFRVSPATGLIDDAVVQFAEDRGGRLWVAGRGGELQGMRLTDLADLAAGRESMVRGIVLGGVDGLGDDACTGRLSRTVAAPARRVVVPLAGGIVRFDPAMIAGESSAAAAPAIRRTDDAPLAFSWSVAGVAWGERPMFQTMLTGFDRDWSAPSDATRREYARVPPGDHEFRVRRVAGETDRDFPVARLSVNVAAPWWRSPVAVAVLAAMAATAGWGISRGLARRRIADLERQRELDRERARIARDIHDSLGAGLTRVALLSDLARRSDRPADIRIRLDAIHHDARDLTRSVDEIVWAVNPGNDTVARFLSYVVHDVEQFSRAGDLSLRLDVPDRLDDDLPLPTGVRHHVCLAVRELLQNVLRHARASHIDFRVVVDEPWLIVTVADDGVGCEGLGDVTIGQDGLANVRARVAEADGDVTIESSVRTGTQVIIRVPLAGPAAKGSRTGRAAHAT